MIHSAAIVLIVCSIHATVVASPKDPGGPGYVSPEARAVMVAFQDAVREGDWHAAAALCTQPVRNAIAEYQSPEAYFRAVVPLDDILKLTRFVYSGCRSQGDDYHGFTCVVERDVMWAWDLCKVDGTWLIDFPPKTLSQYEADERSRLQRERIDHEIARALWEKKVEYARTELSTPVGSEFAVGDYVPLRLKLINEGQETLDYDSHVTEIASFTILDSSGNELPNNFDGRLQSTVFPRPIRPGQTVVLLDNFDLSHIYDLARPGTYQIQFNGFGLKVGVLHDVLPSNVVEITIREAG